MTHSCPTNPCPICYPSYSTYPVDLQEKYDERDRLRRNEPEQTTALPDQLKAAHEAIDHLCQHIEDMARIAGGVGSLHPNDYRPERKAAHAALDAAVLLLRDKLDAHHNFSMTVGEECESCNRVEARKP